MHCIHFALATEGLTCCSHVRAEEWSRDRIEGTHSSRDIIASPCAVRQPCSRSKPSVRLDLPRVVIYKTSITIYDIDYYVHFVS
jgi:hypothetical protein